MFDSIGAFFSDPFKFINDPANTTIAYQLRKQAAAGATEETLKKVLVDNGFVEGSPANDVWLFAKGTVGFLAKNLSLILILGIMVLSVIYVFPIFKKAK